MKKLIIILSFVPIFCYSQPVQKDTVDVFTKISCYVEMFNDNKFLGRATGFFFITATRSYFLTNHHVVGGEFYKQAFIQNNKRDPLPNEVPNRLAIRVYGQNINDTLWISMPLINQSGKNIYLEFYNKPNEMMDVAAIPTPDSLREKVKYTIGLGVDNLKPDIMIFPSDELFIVGFPLDWGVYNTYAIWKRGTIATEPNLKKQNKDFFFIDATTTSGMSGSPVYFRNPLLKTWGSNIIQADNQNTFLIGMYGAQIFPAALGKVWDLTKVIEKLNQITQ